MYFKPCLLLIRLNAATILAPKPSASRYRPENILKHEAKTRLFDRFHRPVRIASGSVWFCNQQVPEMQLNYNYGTHTFTLKHTHTGGALLLELTEAVEGAMHHGICSFKKGVQVDRIPLEGDIDLKQKPNALYRIYYYWT